MTERKCPHCGAPLAHASAQHIKACEAIELALLEAQVTPTVEEVPEGWTIF